MYSISTAELQPLLIRKLLGISTISVVRIAAWRDLTADFSAMNVAEILGKEFFGKDLSTNWRDEDERSQEVLEGDGRGSEDNEAVVSGELENCSRHFLK